MSPITKLATLASLTFSGAFLLSAPANVQGPLIPWEARAAVGAVPEIGAALEGAGISVARQLLRYFLGYEERSALTIPLANLEGRAAIAAALSRNYVYRTLPRVAGQRYVVVLNQTKYEASLKISTNIAIGLPALLADDPYAEVPPSHVQYVANYCSEG